MALNKRHWALGTLIILSSVLLPLRYSPPEALVVQAQEPEVVVPEPLPVKAIECESPLNREQCRIRERIRTEFADIPHFPAVIRCESQYRQYENEDGTGSVLVSPTNDIGITQINKRVWGEEAKRLGFDIMQEDGNLKMARHVYERQGISAWVCASKI